VADLVVELAGSAPEPGGVRVAAPVARDRDHDVVIEGTVRRDGQPAAGAHVRLLDCSGECSAEVVSGAQGQFRFRARPGLWTVRALAVGVRGARSVRIVRVVGARIHVDLALGALPSG
jgi:Protein of unknown function (DUF1416)